MATYVIGDVQGCYDELQRLLDLIKFDSAKDKLWFAGDLVNRGPKSLKTLRFVHNLGKAAKIVLGNHDLHALALYHEVASIRGKDTLDKLLNASDSDELFSWLAKQPLYQYSNKHDVLMVHAGVPVHWGLAELKTQADAVHDQLRNPKKIKKLLSKMYGNTPAHWTQAQSSAGRNRYTINALTRMRFCYMDGTLDLNQKVSPKQMVDDRLAPWFDLFNPKLGETKVVFGHWASLMGYSGKSNFIALDTGCVWGGELTAMHLKSGRRYQVTSDFAAQ